MKTLTKIKILLGFALVLNVGILMSNNSPATGTVNTETEKTIRDYFKFPSVLMPHAGHKVVNNKVEVLFTTDQTGKVNFVLAKTNNSMLKKEIEKQFSTLRLPQLKKDVTHSVTLNFRTL